MPCSAIGSQRPLLAGIFVGGASRRMGAPKGLLTLPGGETLIARWRLVFEGLGIPCVLVGRRAEYEAVPLGVLDDEPAGIGPLGGLVALLREAKAGLAIAVACDMPFVSPELIRRLAGAPTSHAAVAPRRGSLWEPLLARFDAPLALPVAVRRRDRGLHSLQGLLDELDASELSIEPAERAELRDWDSPRDR